MNYTQEVLEHALIGYQHKLTQIEEKIADLRRQLSNGSKVQAFNVTNHSTGTASKKKRVMSAEARARIAAAQVRRWKKVRAQKGRAA